MQTNNAVIKPYTEVIGINIKSNNIESIQVINYATNKEETIKADAFINAGGPWAGNIVQLADIKIDVTPSPELCLL